MNRRWFCSKSARDSTDRPASRCGKHGGGGNGQLHLLKHPQCSAYTCRGASTQEQCSSTGGFAGQHGRSDHRMRLLTVVEAVTLIQCSLRLNRHLQHRAASSGSFPFNRQAWRLVALEWPRWGPPRALRARSSGNAHGRAPTQVHPSGCLSQIASLRSTVSCRRRCSHCSHHPLPLQRTNARSQLRGLF